MININNLLCRLDTSQIVSIVYGCLLTTFLILIGIIALKKLHNSRFKNIKWNDLSFCDKILNWLKLVYKLKNIYVSGLIHIFDVATDLIIMLEWYKLAKSPNNKNSKLNMWGLFISSIFAFSLYRIISSYLVYKYSLEQQLMLE